MLASRFVLPGEHFVANAAFTDRRGGYSSQPFASFNLAHHVGDDEAMVGANRSMLATVLGLQADRLSYVSQVHGTDVHEVTVSAGAASLPRETVVADAQLTTTPGVGLVVLVADCTPVLLADVRTGVIAAVHAGRKGMAAGIVHRTVAAMRRAGADDIRAAIGPAICARCYEVPTEMRAEVATHEPVTASVSRKGMPALDVPGGVAEQLSAEGVVLEHWDDRCTFEDAELFSYRRDGTTGRFAGVVWFDRR
ncbi:peptidoglycan editing factor PgeF [Brevibacterium daeguense]|uniref:Purine nucleoside phosphorylase n=1 Tax=Brevibacterium daeguense TaxID=909936 RepID=A0ABP8EMP6_9MICO